MKKTSLFGPKAKIGFYGCAWVGLTLTFGIGLMIGFGLSVTAGSGALGTALTGVAVVSGVGSFRCFKKLLRHLDPPPPKPHSYVLAEKPLRMQPMGWKFRAVCMTSDETAEFRQRQAIAATVLQGEIKVGRPLRLKF